MAVTVTPHGQNNPNMIGRNAFPHSAALSGVSTYDGDHANTGSHNQLRTPFSQGRHAYIAGHTIDSLPTVSESPDDPGKTPFMHVQSSPSHACGPISSTVPGSPMRAADVECETHDVALQAGSGMFPKRSIGFHGLPFSLRSLSGLSFSRQRGANAARSFTYAHTAEDSQAEHQMRAKSLGQSLMRNFLGSGTKSHDDLDAPNSGEVQSAVHGPHACVVVECKSPAGATKAIAHDRSNINGSTRASVPSEMADAGVKNSYDDIMNAQRVTSAPEVSMAAPVRLPTRL